jgi:hypothetical protein
MEYDLVALGAHRYKRHIRGRMVALAALAVMSCLAWGLPASAQASSSPAIEWTNAWDLTPTDATLGAGINPEGLPAGAYYQFQVVKNTSEYLPEMFCSEGGVVQPIGRGCGGNWGTPPEVIPLGGKIGGSKGQQVSLDLAGAGMMLQPGTTYHYRLLAAKALAEEEGGIFWEHPSVIGPDQTFTTPLASAPSIESESASHVTATGATLEATINPEDLPQGVFYQYQIVKNTSEYLPELACPERSVQLDGEDGCNSPDSGLQPTPGALPIGFIAKGPEGQSVSQSLAAAGMTLQPGTTYHYRVLAARKVQSEDGINWQGPPVEGPDHTFTTLPPPVIDSVSISHLTSSDATLEAQINTEGSATTYQFDMWSSCAHERCEYIREIPLPSGMLLGSFVDQSVSLDLNSVGVTLNDGAEYGWGITATSAAGHTSVSGGVFEPPPSSVIEPLSTTTSPLSGAGQPAGSDTNSSGQSAGLGGSSSSLPNVQSPGLQLSKTTKLESPANARKLSRALKACEKKPRKQWAKCERQARKQFGPVKKKG